MRLNKKHGISVKKGLGLFYFYLLFQVKSSPREIRGPHLILIGSYRQTQFLPRAIKVIEAASTSRICSAFLAMDRLCSCIEMEPKTLTEGQLNNAREAAVDMVQKEAEEAPNISTKGAELVVSMEGMEMNAEKRNGLHSLAELKESADIIKRSWDCQCISPALEESLDRTKIREPRSAPF